MAEQITRVLLEIRWDPDETDHPVAWDYRALMDNRPFTREGSPHTRLISFEDLDSDGRPIQV